MFCVLRFELRVLTGSQAVAFGVDDDRCDDACDLEPFTEKLLAHGLVPESGPLADGQPEIGFATFAERDLTEPDELATGRAGLGLLEIRSDPSGRADELIRNPPEARCVRERRDKRVEHSAHEVESAFVDAVEPRVLMLHTGRYAYFMPTQRSGVSGRLSTDRV